MESSQNHCSNKSLGRRLNNLCSKISARAQPSRDAVAVDCGAGVTGGCVDAVAGRSRFRFLRLLFKKYVQTESASMAVENGGGEQQTSSICMKKKRSKRPPRDVPEGFVGVYVGDEQKQEQPTRYVIPVEYLNHPLFVELLQQAQFVYGFNQKGVFTIPCEISDFEYLRWLIDREFSAAS